VGLPQNHVRKRTLPPPGEFLGLNFPDGMLN